MHLRNEPKMEITIDKEGQSLKLFSLKEIQEVKQMMQEKLGLNEEDVIIRIEKKSSAKYIMLVQDDRHYVVRFADHTYAIPAGEDKILLGIRYAYKANGLNFIIEPSIYRYSHEEIVSAIQETEKWFKHFNSKEILKKIKRFVQEYVEEEGTEDDDIFKDCILYPYTLGMELASLYMKTEEYLNDLNDFAFTALSSIMDRELCFV